MQDLQFLQALCLTASDGILITDAAGTIVQSNPAAQRLLGFSAPELQGRHLEELLPAGEKEQAIQQFKGAKKSVLVGSNGRARMLRKDQEILEAQLVISRVVDRSPYYAAIIREAAGQNPGGDLATTVAALEISQAAISESLLRAETNSQEKSRFVALASHEFRTPLSSIQLSASVIEHYFDRLDRNRIFTHLHKIAAAVADMTGTLDDLLSLEKIESGNMTVTLAPTNLTDFCLVTAEQLQEHLKPGQSIRQVHPQPALQVATDCKLLRHCLVNLLSNAIKYSPENREIGLCSRFENGFFSLSVSDQGIGIPEAERLHLFEPFFRASNVAEIPGTGLGLSIVKKCVGLLGGEVSQADVAGGGSIFTLTFPETVANERS